MENFKKYVLKICEIIELVAAVLVLMAIFISIVGVIKNFEIFQGLLEDTISFKHYLEEIFVIVIGIEFVGMLCRPDSDHVLEVLIFLVARHTIIGDTTPYEDFVSVISIGFLCILRRYLSTSEKAPKNHE